MMKSLVTLVLGMALVGCGGSDQPTLHQLKGEVKFNGQPIPYGRVEFEPDTSKSNSGGVGYADIVDGKYDTASATGRGVIGGPHIVRFFGSNEKPQAASTDGTLDETASAGIDENGKGSGVAKDLPLVSGFEQPHDLPAADGTLNFDLPPEAAAATAAAASAKRRPSNEP
jgi:hypothetical protein